LRVTTSGRIAADCGLEEKLPVVPLTGPTLSLDWGVSPLLMGTVVSKNGSGELVNDGRMVVFRPDRWLRKDKERRQAAAACRAKAVRLERLAEHCRLVSVKATLLQKAEILRQQSRRDEDKRTHANRRMAEAAAAWAVAQAIALGCQRIAVEDLSTLSAGGMGKRTNVRLSQVIRGELQRCLARACLRNQLGFQMVKAPGTSSHCSRCGAKVGFTTASSSNTPGYHWMKCPECHAHADRNANAAANIGARAVSGRNGGTTARPLTVTTTTTLPLKDIPSPRKRSPDGLSVRARRRVYRSVTPPRVGNVRLVQRSAGPVTEAQQEAAQSREDTRVPDMVTVSARDGMRFALRYVVRCSPVRQGVCSDLHR
jgi:transposase